MAVHGGGIFHLLKINGFKMAPEMGKIVFLNNGSVSIRIKKKNETGTHPEFKNKNVEFRGWALYVNLL